MKRVRKDEKSKERYKDIRKDKDVRKEMKI